MSIAEKRFAYLTIATNIWRSAINVASSRVIQSRWKMRKNLSGFWPLVAKIVSRLKVWHKKHELVINAVAGGLLAGIAVYLFGGATQ